MGIRLGKFVIRLGKRVFAAADKKNSKSGANMLRDTKITYDVKYADDDRLYNIYEPKSSETDVSASGTPTKRPLIIGIHGGGLFYGDRNLNLVFNTVLASKGFVVASPEYRLMPTYDFFDALSDICEMLRHIRTQKDQYDKIYIVGDSAGALLAYYAAALSSSTELCTEFGIQPIGLKISGLGLISGMFYLKKESIFKYFYKLFDRNHPNSTCKQYFNHPERLIDKSDLPPMYLVSSKQDFLLRYSRDLDAELTKANKPHKFHNWGKSAIKRRRLGHVFCVSFPDWEESKITIDEMIDYLLHNDNSKS